MYEPKNTIAKQPFDQLQLDKLVKTENLEILSISLEKGALFPEHGSPTDAHLVMLEGTVVFHINETSFLLGKHEYFSFPKEKKHWVKAHENAKFLIIR